jgi:hypothetical protein
MKRAALLAALPAVLALGLVACGDDDDSPSTVQSPSTVENTSRTTAAEPGTTTDEGGDVTLPGGVTIPENIGSLLPGGSLPDLSNLTIPDNLSIPDLGSLPENAREILRSTFPNLSDEQLDCIIDEFGGELDPSRITDVMDQCGIEPRDLIPG